MKDVLSFGITAFVAGLIVGGIVVGATWITIS